MLEKNTDHYSLVQSLFHQDLGVVLVFTPYAPMVLTDLLICIPKHPLLLKIAELLRVYRQWPE